MVGLAVLCARRERAEEALSWLRRAAEQRADPEVLFALGMNYLHGTLSAAKDADLAATWLGRAAEMGHPAAQAQLGLLLLSGADGGGGEGASGAELWLRRAHEQGTVS